MTEDSGPQWIQKEQVLRIHDLQLERHGGLSGLRDEGLLESAISRPKNHHAYERENDLFVLAALYAEAITKNHPFNDGNKRSAHATADLFLYVNGRDLEVGDVKAHIALFENLAAGKVSLEELVLFYRNNTTAIS